MCLNNKVKQEVIGFHNNYCNKCNNKVLGYMVGSFCPVVIFSSLQNLLDMIPYRWIKATAHLFSISVITVSSPNIRRCHMVKENTKSYKFLFCVNFHNWVFCRRRLLEQTDGIDSPGELQWDLTLLLLLCWIIVYFCIWKGPRVTGKVLALFSPT